MAIQTKQQKRAEFALKSLDKYKNEGVPSDTATFIVGMPNMILSNGLGQSLAFLKAKSSKTEDDKKKEDDKYSVVFNILKDYIRNEYNLIFSSIASNDDYSFLKKLNELDQAQYIKMQEEVLHMLEWLKRYARAFANDSKKDKSEA